MLGALVHTGVPLPDAVQVSADSTNNYVFQTKLATVREAMMRGDGLARPITASGLFPPAARQMIRVGESTGSLDLQLQNAAVFYERELSFRLKRFTDMFEPAIILVVGGDGRVRGDRADLRDVQRLPPGEDLTTGSAGGGTRSRPGRPFQGGQEQCSGGQNGRQRQRSASRWSSCSFAVVVVGILTAVAIVGIAGLQDRSTTSACLTTMDAAEIAALAYLLELGRQVSANVR